MTAWTWLVFIAAMVIVAGSLYVMVRWRRSPQAFRAMILLAVCYFVAGALAGAWAIHMSTPSPVEVATREIPRVAPTISPLPGAPTPVPVAPCINCGTPAAMPSAASVSLPKLTYDPVHALRPDPKLTPGDVFPDATKDQVCTAGWASEHRHVTESMRGEVYTEYHRTRGPGCCEVDHLIPLELGGSNDIKNLWPEPDEPRPGDHEKDQLENTLHELVCRGDLPLADAQKCIASDWVKCGQSGRLPTGTDGRVLRRCQRIENCWS
jgi:hypothetical protein